MLVLMTAGLLAVYFTYSNFQPGISKAPITISSAKEINRDAFENYQYNPLPQKPASLLNVSHGVTLAADQYDHLIIDMGIKDLFEFYLSALGEESLSVILNRIQNVFTSQLPPLAVKEAMALLRNYVDYRIELAEVKNTMKLLQASKGANLNALQEQKNQEAQLRQKFFNHETYLAFFEKEDVMDKFMLTQLQIVNDPELSKQHKQQQVRELELTLPEEAQQIRKKAGQHGELNLAVKEMRNEGANDESIFQYRAQTLGEQAARNLAQLDEKRNKWKSRFEHYVLQHNNILESGLSELDSQLAIDQLIQNSFTAREGIRVRALVNGL